MERVLVTGGAGFLGRTLCRELLTCGYRVRVLDALLPQVHGPYAAQPVDLPADVEFLRADLRDESVTSQALNGVDVVIHLASAVGVGQSMYRVAEYVGCNDLGTATLWQAMIDRPIDRPVRRVVVASTMGVYGEGWYRHPVTGAVAPVSPRSAAQLASRRWDYETPDEQPLEPVPITESTPVAPRSVYALTKWQQEELSRLLGAAYNIPVTTLRLFNVFGPGQALSNPYAGVVAIFAARLMQGLAPELFEDGRQLRDFVEVSDVSRAIRLVIERNPPDCLYQVASGRAITLTELATLLARLLGRPEVEPVVTGRYRSGDTRHSVADTTRIDAALSGWRQQSLASGLERLLGWLQSQPCPEIKTAMAIQELNRHGLLTS